MHDKGKVSFGLRCKDASRRETGIVDQKRVIIPSPLDRIGGIGHNQLKRFIVPMLRCGQCIFAGNVELVKTNIMQEHIDTAQVVSSDIDFLSVKSVSNRILAKNLLRFQKQRTRSARRVYQDVIFDTRIMYRNTRETA